MVEPVSATLPILFLSVKNDGSDNVSLIRAPPSATGVGQAHDGPRELVLGLDVPGDFSVRALQMILIIVPVGWHSKSIADVHSP